MDNWVKIMERRSFLKIAGISLSAPLLPFELPGFSNNVDAKRIKPPALKTGDKIEIAAPGSFISQEELELSIKNLTDLGFQPVHNNNILSKEGYLAGSDDLRAGELNRMFADQSVKAIFCARGGYGCNRILPLLDYGIISNNPKLLVGYSDITALTCGIYTKTGLVGLHGPVGISTFNQYSVDNLSKIIFGSELPIIQTNYGSEYFLKGYPIISGKAEGELFGGNLSVLVSLIGSEYFPDLKGKLLFLEEIGEEPYRIDRMLSQLILAGELQKCSGIILGIFEKCEAKERNPEFPRSFTLKEVLYDRLYNLNIPAAYGFAFGHVSDKMTLPVGINAAADMNEFTISITENVVV